MSNRLRLVFWPEVILACIASVLAVLTFVWPDWLERVTGLHPDAHSGSLEWILAMACGLAALLLGTLARREWRRAMAGPAA